MAGLKRRLDRFETEFNDLVLMRRGDKAAANRLLDREWKALIEDLFTVPDLYAAEVERMIASVSAHVAAQYRAAWQLILAAIEADRTGDEARGTALTVQIDEAFCALPELNGGQMWKIYYDFYDANRPGFKLPDQDVLKIAELLCEEDIE